jgi:hypothetical protein
MKVSSLPCLAAAALLPVLSLQSLATSIPPDPDVIYRNAVHATAGMSRDKEAQKLAKKFGLQILDLTWEDTGRYKGSSVGPNISDMTIQVASPVPDTEKQSIHCMPVIRFPNFSDKTGDLDPKKFFLLVGNERGQPLRRISLYEFLDNPTLYLNDPGSWSGEGRRSLLAPARDSKVLVSAQACFLPVPNKGEASFNPVLFNYQSMKEDPAVLTILATREGTSVTVIDNTRDAFEEGSSWGQRLFFNENGQRASLTGTRESDFREADPDTGTNPTAEAAGEEGLNLVLLIQVPLKQRNPMSFGGGDGAVFAVAESASAPLARSDVENAVIGHGELEGPFTEIDRLPIERDPKFPIRVTVQFYKATSNGAVSPEDLTSIKEQIDRIYDQSEYVGSLVTRGDTGRVTEYDGPKIQPAHWWEQFWKRHEENTGDTREEAIRKLEKLLGREFRERPVSRDYLHTLLESTPLPEGIEPAKAGDGDKKGFFKKLFGK